MNRLSCLLKIGRRKVGRNVPELRDNVFLKLNSGEIITPEWVNVCISNLGYCEIPGDGIYSFWENLISDNDLSSDSTVEDIENAVNNQIFIEKIPEA